MIRYDNTLYCTQAEFDLLNDLFKQGAVVYDNEVVGFVFDGLTIQIVSEAFLKLASAFDISSIDEMNQALKPEQKRFRCRVCGRWYDFKSDAKACMRNHRK